MMTTKVASDADITLAVRPAPVGLADVALPAASPAVKAVGGWVVAISELTVAVNRLAQVLEKAKEAAPVPPAAPAPTAPPVVAPVTPTPVTVTAQVNPEQVRQDLAKVDMMVSQFKEPAWLRDARAKWVGTIVSAAGVIAGGVGSLAMGLDPSFRAAACLAAPVIKYTIDKICRGWRTDSYQATINKAIKEANGAGSWIEQLAHTKALINIVNKFASPNSKDQPIVVKKLEAEAGKLTAKINEQKSFELRTELFPVSQREIQSLKGAGGGWPLVMDLAFYAGTMGSIGLFSGEMVSAYEQLVSWYRAFF